MIKTQVASFPAFFRVTASLAVLLLGLGSTPRPAQAQESSPEFAAGSPLVPYGSEIRRYYYAQLRKSPGKALLWELALPGAGNVYTRIYAGAIVTAVITLTGVGLWIAGAATDRDALWWAGAGTFAGGRAYGLISAPVGARLLNAAFRRQLGLRDP